MERRRAVGPISTRRVRIADPIFPRRPRSRSLRLLYFLPLLMKYSKGRKCEKKRKQEQGFSLSPGAQEQFSLLLFCLHIKSSSLLCAVCSSSTLYTFPRNDIVQSSRSRAFCSYYGLQTFTHRESSPHNPAALARLLCLRRWHCCSVLCLVIYPKTYVRAGLVYLLSTIDVRCREV
jgi:hypothetical protein